MRLNELLHQIDFKEITADMNMEISGVCYDSRDVQPGNVFVAVSGYETDGFKYIGQAIKNGAAAVVCQHRPEEDVPFVIVDNSRHALAVMSANFFGRPGDEMKIIGITGTNGKTTSTTLIKSVIEQCLGAKVGLIGTNHNMIGQKILETERTTPESYELQKLFRQMRDEECSYVVMEVSSHSLFLNRVDAITFEVGVFTNLTQDHLDFHKTMDNYAKAKAILFTRCKTGVVNIDDAYANVMLDAARCPVITVSDRNDKADMVAKNIRLSSDKVDFCVLHNEGLDKVELHIPGEFSVYNAMSVIACAKALGISVAEASNALKNCHGVKGRVEVVPTGLDFTMIIDYAHTPDALENVLNTARGFTKGRLMVLFGCGGDRDNKKRPIMGNIAAQLADFVIVTSDNPRTENPGAIIREILEGMKNTKTPYVVIEDRIEAIGYAMDNAKSGDVVILAGKGHETYQIVGKEKHHMDEREIIAEHLSTMKKCLQ